jgi:glucokinase
MKNFIGVDIGGTNIVCGLVQADGRVVLRRKFPTAPARGADAVLEQLAQEAERLAAEAGLSWDQVGAIGLGVPGFVDPKRGVSTLAVNLGWENVPVAEKLRARLGKPVAIDNDVRMYIYGEAMLGAGQGHEHVLGVTVGTGLAAALVNAGEIYYGSGFLAGELGHVPIDGESERCGCGNLGCLETIVSATGIARMGRQAVERGEQTLLRDMAAKAPLTSADVSKAYAAGDAVAAQVLAYAGRTLGKALSYVVPLVSPDVIVIGGGGALAGAPLFVPLEEELAARLLPFYRERLKIVPATLGDDAGVVGSALRAKLATN